MDDKDIIVMMSILSTLLLLFSTNMLFIIAAKL